MKYIVLMSVLLPLLVACSGAPAATQTPLPSYTPLPTYTPYPTRKPIPTTIPTRTPTVREYEDSYLELARQYITGEYFRSVNALLYEFKKCTSAAHTNALCRQKIEKANDDIPAVIALLKDLQKAPPFLTARVSKAALAIDEVITYLQNAYDQFKELVGEQGKDRDLAVALQSLQWSLDAANLALHELAFAVRR